VNAGWAAVLLGSGGLAGSVVSWALAILTRGARRDGKVDQILDELKEIARDHEQRLRAGGL
jgi:hypothetical protein